MNWYLVLGSPFILALVAWMIWEMLSQMNEHTVYLYARSSAPDAHGVKVRLAIQNGEDVPLRTESGMRWRVQIRAEPEGGALTERPLVFLGPRHLQNGLKDGNREFWLEFEELPANDTWIFDCHLDARAHSLALSLHETRAGAPVHRRLRPVSVSALRIDVRREHWVLNGSTVLPSWSFAAVTIGLVVMLYFGIVLFCSYQWPSWFLTPLSWRRDLGIAVALAICGVGLLKLVQRAAPPIIQGYLRPSELAPTLRQL